MDSNIAALPTLEKNWVTWSYAAAIRGPGCGGERGDTG